MARQVILSLFGSTHRDVRRGPPSTFKGAPSRCNALRKARSAEEERETSASLQRQQTSRRRGTAARCALLPQGREGSPPEEGGPQCTATGEEPQASSPVAEVSVSSAVFVSAVPAAAERGSTGGHAADGGGGDPSLSVAAVVTVVVVSSFAQASQEGNEEQGPLTEDGEGASSSPGRLREAARDSLRMARRLTELKVIKKTRGRQAWTAGYWRTAPRGAPPPPPPPPPPPLTPPRPSRAAAASEALAAAAAEEDEASAQETEATQTKDLSTLT
ncbi:hypothetical protein Esti_002290 [Eimeria stiedai]